MTTQKKVYRTMVPKLSELGPLAFEGFLASLHGLLGHHKHHTYDTLSFEFTNIEGRLWLYMVVPTDLSTMIIAQLYAQYPTAIIQEADEYFTRQLIHNKHIITASLKTIGSLFFPIKRWPQFMDSSQKVSFQDPLSALTSALSQLQSTTDTAIIQVVMHPISLKWNHKAEDILPEFLEDWSQYQKIRWVKNIRLWYLNTYWELTYNTYLTLKNSSNPFMYILWKIWHVIRRLLAMNTDGTEIDVLASGKVQGQSTTTGQHSSESLSNAVFDKIRRVHFAVNIRVCMISNNENERVIMAKIKEICGTFQQFSLPGMNSLQVDYQASGEDNSLFRSLYRRNVDKPFTISQEELATIMHLPTQSVKTPGIQWVEARTLEPPVYLPSPDEGDVTIIGKTNFRGTNRLYGIKKEDRMRHTYIIGKTGMGKSVLLENMVYSDICNGHGVMFIDPLGDSAEFILKLIPKKRINDVVLIDPSDTEYPIAFNLLEGKNITHRSLIASGVVGAFKKLFAESWGPRLEYFLRNTVLALVEAPDTTMLGIPRMLVDKDYRGKILHYVKNPTVKAFWEQEFSQIQPKNMADVIGPIQNKVGQFLSTPFIRNILGQTKSAIDVRFAMDTGKIVIVNLSKGKIGEDNAALLGSLLITKVQLDAMSRADQDVKDRRDFYLYVDEFQNFATNSFATILSEARKYRLSLTMANQYVAQMPEEVRDAVFGNVGSMITFQVGIMDGQAFAEQFDEDRITPIEIASLPKYNVYNRIMVKGLTTPVFSGSTLAPQNYDKDVADETVKKIYAHSRQRYTKPRLEVEERIMRWSRAENEKNKDADNDTKDAKKDDIKSTKTDAITPKTTKKENVKS